MKPPQRAPPSWPHELRGEEWKTWGIKEGQRGLEDTSPGSSWISFRTQQWKGGPGSGILASF